jgi:hypothetical protein
MAFVPYERFDLEVAIPVAEARARLQQALAPHAGGLYVGAVRGDEFIFSQSVKQRDTLWPTAQGRLSDVGGRTRVDVRVRPHLFFATALIAVPLLALALLALSPGAPGTGWTPLLLVALVLGWMAYSTARFRGELPRLRADLTRMLTPAPAAAPPDPPR